MEKRYVLALVLMVAVMFGWSWFYGRKLPKPTQTTERATEQSRRLHLSHQMHRHLPVKQQVNPHE